MTRIGKLLDARIARPLRRQLALRDQPGRGLDVHADDTFIVSYPKSGNTWVRFLVGSLLHPGSPTDFANIDARVPTIYKATARELAALARPRVLKSHEYFDPRYPRVIYVVRDPRDVLVSYYHYSLRKGFIDDGRAIAGFADEFLAGRINAFGTWHENVASWRAARGHENVASLRAERGESASFVLVRYEDLKRDCEGELARIAAMLGLSPDRAELARVVAECSFERMRVLERTTGDDTVLMKHQRSEIAFVRQGTSGGWKDELPPPVVARLEAAWAPLMTELGYRGSAEQLTTGRGR